MSQTFLLNTVEAAKYLHLATPTLEKLRVYGGGPKFVRLGKRAVRYRPADLEVWLESRVRTSTSDTGVGNSSRKRGVGHDR